MTNTLNLTSATSALVLAATAMDRAVAKTEPAKQAWAVYCATHIRAGALTIEQVAEALVGAARERVGKRKGASINSITDVSKGVSSTLAGWYYDLKRVLAAGDGIVDLLLAGTSLTTLRRGTDPTQPKAPRKAKAGNDNAPATNTAAPAPTVIVSPPSSFAEACAAVIEACERADVKAIAKSNQLQLSKAQAALAKLAGQVEAHIKAAAEAKAARAAKPRQRKAA